MNEKFRAWCEAAGVVLGEDGIPLRSPGEPGPAKPCYRCGVMAECQLDGVAYLNGRRRDGPLCEDCYRLLFVDSRAFYVAFDDGGAGS